MKITEVELQLTNQLKDPDDLKRYEAIGKLASFHLSPSHEDWADIKLGIIMPAQRRSFFTTEPLIDILNNDSSPRNRSMAATVLGDYGDLRAIASLRKCLNETNLELVINVIKALGKLKDEGSIPKFLSFLDKSYDKWIRIESIGALCSLDYTSSQKYLRKILNDLGDDRNVRYEAMNGLVTLSHRKGSQIKTDLILLTSDSQEQIKMVAKQWLEIIAMDEQNNNSNNDEK